MFVVLTGSRFGQYRHEAGEQRAQDVSGDAAQYPAVAVQFRLRLVMDSHISLSQIYSIQLIYIQSQQRDKTNSNPFDALNLN